MANKKVSQLTSKPSVLVTDLFPIADPSTGQLYKTTISDLGTAIGSGVSSVNGLVGAVVLDTDDIQELVSPTNKWFTDTRARAAISAGTGISYNSGTGVITNAVTSGQIATALGYTPADDSLVVKLAGSQTITGVKTFDAIQRFNFGLSVKSVGGANQGIFGNDNGFNFGVNAYTHSLLFPNSGGYNYTLPATTGTIALTSDLSAYALDSAVVKLTGNQTVAGQKTFSSTLYGASAVFSSAVNVQSINVTGITASPSVYITTNGTNHAVSIVQSGAGYAIYASGNVAVIGTGYFSSSLTAASLASTAGYNFTLPSASGTLALTSQLSSYLPLTGGTLTGALSGTSATFSSTIFGNAPLNNTVITTSDATNITNGFNLLGSSSYWGIRTATSGNFNLDVYGAGAPKNALSIAQSTGAATFSSSVTAGAIISTGVSTFTRSALTFTLNPSYGGGDVYTQLQSTGALSLATGGDNNRLYINSSGNVGIGTTSPFTSSGYTVLDLYGASSGGHFLVRSPNVTAEYQVDEGSGGAYFGTRTNHFVSFRTNTSERMRITSGGNVGIGTTGSSSIRLITCGADSGSSNYSFVAADNGGNTKFGVRNDGLLFMTSLISTFTTLNAPNMWVNPADGAVSRSTASSRRFKENIKDWDESGLNTILGLKPKTFTYKADYYKNPELKILGLIAEEVSEVSPFLAEYQNEDRTGQVENVRYANIVVPLIKAVQELKAELDTLKNK